VDANGNVIVAANITAAVTIGGVTHTPPANGVALLVVKLDPTGQNVLWARDYGSDSYIYADAIAVDGAGNIYLAGAGQGDKIGAWSLANPHPGSLFGYVASLKGTDGSVRWAITPDTSATTENLCYAVTAAGPAGEIAAACSFGGSVQLTSTTYINFTAQGQGDAFVAALDSGSGRVNWAKNIGGNQFERIRSITRNANADVIVSGGSGSASIGDGTFSLPAPPSAAGFAFVLRISKVSPNNKITFGRAYGGPNASVQDGYVAATSAGQIVMCTGWNGTVDFGTGPVTSAGTSSSGQDVVLVAADPATNNTPWAITYGGIYQESCYGVSADSFGSVLVAGTHDSASISIKGTPLPDPPPRSGAGSRAGHVFKVDPRGKVLWLYGVTSGDTGASDFIESVSVVPVSNRVVYSGRFVGRVDLGSGSATLSANNGAAYSFFVVERTP
jgi:hypothetical protein